MSTLTTAHDMTQIGHRAAARAADLAATVTAMTATALPDGLAADVAELADLAETAETVFDIAERECADAREQLAQAQARLEAADDEWLRASREMSAARTALGQLCRANGVYRTADGLQMAAAR